MRVTVVVPCHNHGEYLLDCIVSLMGGTTEYCAKLGLSEGQDMKDFELILVDDCSEDNSWGVMTSAVQVSRELGRSVTGIRINHHMGTSIALNTGIRKAKGDYIAVVHADDLVEPWHLSSLLARATLSTFCYGDLCKVKNGERGAIMRFADWDTEKAKQKNLAHAAILFPRKAMERVQYPTGMREGREDWGFTLRLAMAGYEGVHVAGDPSYLYRREGQGRSSHNHTAEWHRKFRAQMREAVPEAYG